MKNFYKALFVCVVFVWVAGAAFAQVDQGELQKNLAPVTFINFEGPHARVESREQIRQIGVGQGQVVKAGTVRAGAANRYFVIHSVSGPDGDRLDADIFGLGPNASVDHVRNLRLIIQGYLQAAYDYSEKDAALLAEYITIYNAVYRGDWDYFSNRFKRPVLGHINARQAGLSTRYTEWPGNTLMLIPLGDGRAVDTAAISDDRVVEEMRKEDDRSIGQRRDMVDLKEREADDAERRATEQRRAVQEEEKAIAEERARREGTDADDEDLRKREDELVLQREEAARQEQIAERKTEDAQRDRESIARDQQDMIDQGEQPRGVIGVTLERNNATLGRLVSLNPANRQELRRSPLDTVYVRTLTFIDNKILAIAGENRGNGAVRLIEINSRTLEMVRQGDDDLHSGSLIWVNGKDLYAITANLANGTFNLGRFNSNLALQVKSGITIHPNASIHVQDGSLLTQRADGSAVILDPASLVERGL
ncbi:MAG: hypothetical protein FWD36_04495 [Treponema sp.]|nr:hypothetical protein [Treponema sp.]